MNFTVYIPQLPWGHRSCSGKQGLGLACSEELTPEPALLDIPEKWPPSSVTSSVCRRGLVQARGWLPPAPPAPPSLTTGSLHAALPRTERQAWARPPTCHRRPQT